MGVTLGVALTDGTDPGTIRRFCELRSHAGKVISTIAVIAKQEITVLITSAATTDRYRCSFAFRGIGCRVVANCAAFAIDAVPA